MEPQDSDTFAVARPGAGLGGSNASCVAIQPEGGMSFYCRYGCGKEGGPQPFAGVSNIAFWLRDPTKPGTIPPLRIILGNQDEQRFCNAKPYLVRSNEAGRPPPYYCTGMAPAYTDHTHLASYHAAACTHLLDALLPVGPSSNSHSRSSQ